MRVAICTPCNDDVSAGYALDLAKLVGFMARHHADVEIVLFHNRGSILPAQRATLVSAALEQNADAVLWIDADMRFPKDALHRLLAHDVPIVGANYAARRPPFLPVAEHHEHGTLFTEPGASGLADVSHAGFGLMLVQSAVFREIPRPWFALGYSKADDGYVGEDVFFCRKAKEAGFVTRIDQAVSRDVRHVGEMEITHEHTYITRDAYLKPKIELVGA